MTYRTLALRSLIFYARSHIAVLLGAAVGTAVLLGALVVGDSVRSSLRQFAFMRLGKTQLALAANDRFFRSQLAEDLTRRGLETTPVLQLLGTATTGDSSARANRVQVLGVDDRFWKLGNQSPSFNLPSLDEVVLNQRLAEQLKVKIGDTVLLRVPKPSQLSRDAPISPQENSSVALRLSVGAIASDKEFGRFSLQANQVAPFNAFIQLGWLGERLALPGRANLVLVGANNAAPILENATTTLRQTWQLADAELELRELPASGAIEVRTPRIFLDAPIAEAALRLMTNATGILTYFVNELRVGERATPYSMVAAAAPPLTHPDLRDDEVLINQWLAEDLDAKAGDELKLAYFVVGVMRRLEERTALFRIRAILPMTDPTADRELMPEFPGIAKANNCRDWDAGFAIDTSRIRDRDQKYWDEYRGTPKAFVTLAAGQKMWSNRFGNLTAVRYPLAGNSVAKIEAALRRAVDPASVGLSFQPVRAQAAAASEQSLDFGQLFLGFSFFLIIAALLLMGLLFQFGIEQRTVEVGTLLALGFQPRQIRRLLLWEGVALAVVGSLIGIPGGLAYARSMLHGLSTVWRAAVGTTALDYHVEPTTLVLGAVAGAAVAFFTIWLALRKQAQRSARELLADTGECDLDAGGKAGKPRRNIWIAVVAALGAFALIGFALKQQDAAAAGAFFGSGALLLIAGMALCSALLWSLEHSGAAARLSLAGMGVRNATRRRKRSLAILGLLACGSFLVVAVGAFRLDPSQGAEKPSSGTGGFALFGETSLPVVHDLNSQSGREFFGLDPKLLESVRIVQLRVRDGDDASCLNLNRAQTPRLLGVRPELLEERGAFTFAGVAKGFSRDHPWQLLAAKLPDGAVPAVGDEASILWALGKKLGDTLTYTDERGRAFKVRLVGALANSILQGSLLIAEEEFVARFRSEGYRMFLIDAPSNTVASVSDRLSRALRDVGLELSPTTRRLAEFNAVQNTYLSTFQVLGGLGLLLGSVGLGVVVLRNVLERRGELALLMAVGFRVRALKWLLVSEHGALLLAGLGVGVLAAGVAVLPSLLSPGAELPYRSMGLTLAAVFVSGLWWTWLATSLALRGRIIEALRNN